MPSDDSIVTAAEMESMTPDRRQQTFDDHIVTDLAELPPEVIERARAKGRKLLEARGMIDPIQT